MVRAGSGQSKPILDWLRRARIGIRFILLQNRQGKTRLAKYYIPLEESEKHKVEYEVHRLVVNRDPKFTNFVEFRTHKVIYRRYAGLFFSLCVDMTDNELAYLESIHLFVEILDHFFSNVCISDIGRVHSCWGAPRNKQEGNYRENGGIGKAGVKNYVAGGAVQILILFPSILCLL
ncbi:SNARE-like superfamily protein [Actinidia rufa]|uniref:SNARE-like superfamily protein n=1 Tax=Actinidia rufa TaxID=165716 RepID=A0A7J0DJT1_9ERIC|nr:SNARE-like superfamily protein [Actinidia rufa]